MQWRSPTQGSLVGWFYRQMSPEAQDTALPDALTHLKLLPRDLPGSLQPTTDISEESVLCSGSTATYGKDYQEVKLA